MEIPLEPGNRRITLSPVAGIGLACLLGCLIGCLDQADGDPTLETLPHTGIIRNTCGPADGPAVVIRVDQGAPQGCAGSMDVRDTLNNRYVLYLPDILVDSLKVLRSVSVMQELCEQSPCADRNYYRLDIDKIRNGKVHGTVEVTPIRNGYGDIGMRTPVHLTICPMTGMCG